MGTILWKVLCTAVDKHSKLLKPWHKVIHDEKKGSLLGLPGAVVKRGPGFRRRRA
jgi:hypothetical protein